jgi:hypothetical protein
VLWLGGLGHIPGADWEGRHEASPAALAPVRPVSGVSGVAGSELVVVRDERPALRPVWSAAGPARRRLGNGERPQLDLRPARA